MTRIVAWNCNEALDRKTGALLALEPDIAVISECASHVERVGPLERLAWVGSYGRRGLAVFARPELGGRVGAIFDIQWFIPVTFDGIDLRLLGVWAMNQRGTLGGDKYGRTHKVLEAQHGFLETADLVIGDFNDNVRWDTRTRPSFTDTTRILDGLGYENLYYRAHPEVIAGQEPIGTLYFHRHADEPYLIDHAFLRRSRLPDLQAFEIGEAAAWLEHSDHMPLLVDIERTRATSPTVGSEAAPRTPCPSDA